MLRGWRGAAERLAHLNIGRRDPFVHELRSSFGYVVAVGWEGLDQIARGADGLLGRRMGYRILDSPALRGIVAASRWWLAARGEFVQSIDWARLGELGAPIPAADRGRLSRARDAMHELGVPDAAYIRRKATWIDFESATCGGESALDDYLPAAFGPRRRAKLIRWLKSHLPRRASGSSREEFEVPFLELLEPQAYCLALRHEFTPGTRVRLSGAGAGAGAAMPQIVLDERPVLIPLGWGFRPEIDARSHKLDEFAEFEPAGDPASEDDSIDDCWVGIGHDDAEGPAIAELQWFLGDHFVPDDVEVTAPDGTPLPAPALRRPYAMREFLTFGLYGMSCPEVFVRHAGGRWRYWGAVLVGATPKQARRSERHDLSFLSAGDELEVVLREVPGERAHLRCALVTRDALPRDAVLPEADVLLGVRDVLRMTIVADCDSRIDLVVDGYFERIDGAHSQPATTGHARQR